MTPDTLHAQLVAAVAAERWQTVALLQHAEQNAAAVKDPRLLGRYIPGWHDWPDVIRAAQLIIRRCDAVLAILAEVQGWRHESVEDGWYSCSTDPNCADDSRAGQPCDCGLSERKLAILHPLAAGYGVAC